MRIFVMFRSCLAEFNVAGLSTNINFLMDLASHPEFIKVKGVFLFVELGQNLVIRSKQSL